MAASDDDKSTDGKPAPATRKATSGPSASTTTSAPTGSDRDFRTKFPVDRFELKVGDGDDQRRYVLTRTEWTTVPAADVEAVLDEANRCNQPIRTRKTPNQ